MESDVLNALNISSDIVSISNFNNFVLPSNL